MTITTHKRPILLFAALFGLACSASANLWLSDSFNTGGGTYSVGTLGDQNPTVMTPGPGDVFGPYDDAWGAATWSGNEGWGAPVVSDSGLSYTGFLSSGGAVRMQRVNGDPGTTGSQDGRIDLDSTQLPNLANGSTETIYFSYLVDFGEAQSVGAGIHIYDSNSNRDVFWGLEKDQEGTAFARMYRTGSPSEAVSSASFDVSDTTLIVGRIRFDSGNDFRADLFVNPDLSQPQPTPTLADYWVGWVSVDVVTGLNFEATMETGTAATYFDEFRIGESWESVTPIPEPGTLVLVGIALGSLLLFRKRRG